MRYVLFVLFFISSPSFAAPYFLPNEPIDVVIPCTKKDIETLDLCIAGIMAYCHDVRRVIVVSSSRLTDQAEWFNEALYPFSKQDVAMHLLKKAKRVLKGACRVGWYYQQLLKFYAAFVIPGLSSNVLVLDADTIFLNPVTFLNAAGGGLYNPGKEFHRPYFIHAGSLLPGLIRLYPEYSGISHHMLFQRSVLEDLFSSVERYHLIPLWQAFCHSVSIQDISRSGASEYEIYFNYVFSRTDQVQIRPLKWANVSTLRHCQKLKDQGYHYLSCHTWLQNE